MALVSSGALDDMESRGVDRLFYYQVDNPLVRMADPAYLGFHENAGAQMSCKVVRKRDPMEKVGVVARAGDRIEMVEYTELADEERYLCDADGQLAFWAGNIAIHIFNTDFIRHVADEAATLLPFHPSAKVIPNVTRARDGGVENSKPGEPNGYKFERFVFDALPVAERVCVLEASAREEFSPIKNARGPDSLATAQADMVALYRGWLEESGIDLPAKYDVVEIDHSQVDSAAEVTKLGASELADLDKVVRVATGMDS
jgi:UDP-N-acetylglucosamine/UDP-N-acetylgalactosamine diphosphorylase